MEELQQIAQIAAVLAGITTAGALAWTLVTRAGATSNQRRTRQTRRGLRITVAALTVMLIAMGTTLTGENRMEQAGMLPAGLPARETDDNEDFQNYLEYTRRYAKEYTWEDQANLEARQVITVTGPGGRPVRNATVKLPSGKYSTTYTDGRTLLFPPEGTGPTITVMKGGEETQAQPGPEGRPGHWTATIRDPGGNPGEVPLDLMLLLDSTQGMEEELAELRQGMPGVLEEISARFPKTRLRLALMSYRDHQEEYVTRLWDFQEDEDAFLEVLGSTSAQGGEAPPDALGEALHEAVLHAAWMKDSARVIFLVADAPPHMATDQSWEYHQEIEDARQTGVRIHALGAEGLGPQGEYVLRQAAQQTMGRFISLEAQAGDPADRPNLAKTIQRLVLEELDPGQHQP